MNPLRKSKIKTFSSVGCALKASLMIVCLTWINIHMAIAKTIDFNSDPNMAMVSPEIKAICSKAECQGLPQQAQDDISAAKSNHCDLLNDYYGFNKSPDFIKARQCAYLEKNYGILSMIYANGKGITRNWDLAIYFACRAGFAPAEIEGRVKHLLQLQHENDTSANFDICDDVTSGYMAGRCADIQERLQQSKRQLKWAKLMSNWSDQDKKAFAPLQKAAENFFNTRLDNEVDLSGTGREALIIEERENLENNWFSNLENLTQGLLPNYSINQYQQKDKELNSIYKKIQAQKDFNMGTVNQKGIKKTQQAWIQYKNAWVNYGKNKYPQVKADSWQAWLTEQRIKMLEELAE